MKSFRLPFLLFALPAVVLALAPDRSDVLALTKDVIARGQFWRLWTGHWIHFSPSHLVWNLLAIVPAGALLERRRPGWLLQHALVAAPLIALALLVLEPTMRQFGGLSALAVSVLVLAALDRWMAGGPDRALWSAVLLLTGVKLGYDLTHTTALLSRFTSPDVRPSTYAHAVGAGAALLLYPLWSTRGRFPRKNETAGTRDGFPAARFRSCFPSTGWTHQQTEEAPPLIRGSRCAATFFIPRAES